MSYQYIILEEKANIALITMNRPDRLNALGGELITEMKDAVAKVRPQIQEGQRRVCADIPKDKMAETLELIWGLYKNPVVSWNQQKDENGMQRGKGG